MKQLTKIIALTMLLNMGLTGCGSTTDDPASAAQQENDNASVNMAVDTVTKVATKAINADIKDESDHINIKSNGQEITVSNAKNKEMASIQAGPSMAIPDDFPTDIIVPDNLKLSNVLSLDGGHTVTGASKQNAATLIEQTDKELRDLGWESSIKSHSSEGGLYLYQKGDRVVSYIIVKVDNKDLEKYPGYVSSVTITFENDAT